MSESANLLTTVNRLENRTSGSVITGAMTGQMVERATHLEQLRDPRIKLGDLQRSNFLDFGTRAIALLPEREQVPDLLDRKAQCARLMNEPQHLDIVCTIDSIPANRAPCRRHQIDALVVCLLYTF